MATGIDRSKYRNPDMPVGYVKQEPELIYKYGIEIDGVHYIWAPFIFEAHIEQRADYAQLSDPYISDDEEYPVKPTKKPSTVNPKEKDGIAIKKEPEETSDIESKVPKHGKKGHVSNDTSTLDAALSHMDISSVKKERKRKKTKKIKKESKRSYSSDSSSPPSRHHSPIKHSPRHHSSSSYRRYRSPSADKSGKIITYSPSPSPERYAKVKVKEEPLDQSQHLFGSYTCDVCNITMNSLLTYNTHVNGRRHRKNLTAKIVPEIAAQSIPAAVVLAGDSSRYPKPPAGVIRKRVNTLARFQAISDADLPRPCPGLNFVTEIQGLADIQYYCRMCDSVCAPSSIMSHLKGFKHRLHSVKQFKPGAYEDIKDAPKHKAEPAISSILLAIEKKDGRGRMAVEIEELASHSKDMRYSGCQPSTSTYKESRNEQTKDIRNQPSTSKGSSTEYSDLSFKEKYDKSTIPNMSASDFYCEICQSHMNSLQMWEAHIRGKRHLTNLKKMPGDRPSKNKTILVDDPAYLFQILQRDCPPEEPIIGLKDVREINILETKSHSYQCFLCGSCHTTQDIVDHLISLKHRTKYLERINFVGLEVISGMSDSVAYGLVKDMCAEVQAEEGTGKPEVHITKNLLGR